MSSFTFALLVTKSPTERLIQNIDVIKKVRFVMKAGIVSVEPDRGKSAPRSNER